MTRSPARARRRAKFLAAVALPLVVMTGLTAGYLTRSAPSPRMGVLDGNHPRAYGEAPPPQALAITADFFEAMAIDPRAESPAPQKAPDRLTERLAERRCPASSPAMATAETPRRAAPADSAARATPPYSLTVADGRAGTTSDSSPIVTSRPPVPAAAPPARQRSSSTLR